MAANRWYFSREQIRNTPSVRDGIDYAKELGYRQQCANFIQDIGQRLSVNQLCINTSIVYMHRFYMFHSFKYFHRNVMAPCFLFLGAKVEEQPRKIEHVLKVAYRCLHKDSEAQMDIQSDEYMQMAQDLIDNESILLQTLGFELSVEHPHTYVVKCAQMVKAAKDLAQTSYFLATNSLHLTTFCIEQRPTVVACVCIYVACKWTSYEIPESHDKKHWWQYMDKDITFALIEDMTSHFIKILDSCPTRLKKKISTGPVIYKGGALQSKREEEGTSGTSDKQKGMSSTKGSSKTEKKSSNSESLSHNPTGTDKQSLKTDKYSDFSKTKSRNEHSVSTHGSQEQRSRHGDHSKHSELEKRHADGHKHRSDHKHRHSDHPRHQNEHSKHSSERLKTEDSNLDKHHKKHESKDNQKLTESKTSPAFSRQPEISKGASSDELSQAEKLILSLPPLQHKHSLPLSERLQSESPAKKKKIDSSVSPTKTQKLDFDASKAGGPSSTMSIPGSGHHKRHKMSHSKDQLLLKDKHKQKALSDKHASLHKHKQHSSHSSSHGKKHHSKSVIKNDQLKISNLEAEISDKILPATSDTKHSSDEQIAITTLQNTSSNIPGNVTLKSTKTPQKPMVNPPEKESLPPPPPPPSVDIASVLGSPPVPSAGISDMFGKQTKTPSKHEQSKSSESTFGLQNKQSVLFMPSQSLMHSTQTSSISSLAPPQQVQASYGILHMQPETAVQQQAFQQQPQFLTPSLYFQEPESQSTTLQTFEIPGLPRPPPGMILTQVNGLPPPPPINFPFPPPPT